MRVKVIVKAKVKVKVKLRHSSRCLHVQYKVPISKTMCFLTPRSTLCKVGEKSGSLALLCRGSQTNSEPRPR